MSDIGTPYSNLPDHAYWRRAVASVAAGQVDPVGEFRLKITRDTRVATAGSCFAQHIARHLKASGYRYFVTETAHPLVRKVEGQHQYGVFSARYGNIYTARQLVQLIERAYTRFSPLEDVWIEADGRVLDPFRPTVQPGGFVSVSEMKADRRQHLAAVRSLFESLDVFIFTLGLTECWRSRHDGAVFPICPGVSGGVFNPADHVFMNQTVGEVADDLAAFITALRAVNPNAQVVLTVSPVPLVATAQPGAHVLAATAYSKSVLRVAAEETCQRLSDVYYFPSFEIITGSFNRGAYYAADLRSVTEEGVEHVMRVFLKHATSTAVHEAAPVNGGAQTLEEDAYLEGAERLIQVECDEVALDSGG